MKGYCEQHAKLRSWGSYQKQRGTPTQRGYGSEWRKLRAKIMERDGYLCQVCRANGRLTEAREVDHIVNKASNDGNDDPSNLQAICVKCHREKTARERGQR